MKYGKEETRWKRIGKEKKGRGRKKKKNRNEMEMWKE